MFLMMQNRRESSFFLFAIMSFIAHCVSGYVNLDFCRHIKNVVPAVKVHMYMFRQFKKSVISSFVLKNAAQIAEFCDQCLLPFRF